MTLEQLLDAGAYVVAGYVDLPGNGTGRPVQRLAQLLVSGDLILTAAGEAFARSLAEKEAPQGDVSAVLEGQIVEPPKPDKPATPKAKRGRKAKEAVVIELRDVGNLSDLLGG